MEITQTQFKRLRNRIIKQYPNATTKIDSNGLFYVSDGSGRLMSEYLIPPQKTVAEAWYWVSDVIKIDKNIQRSHPNRMSSKDVEAKFSRISKRNTRK